MAEPPSESDDQPNGSILAEIRFFGLVVVPYLFAPPAALLAGAYGVSYVTGVSFGNLVFVLTMLTLVAWILTAGSFQTASTGGSDGLNVIDHQMVHRGTTGEGMDGEGQPDAGARSTAVMRYYAADLLSPSYLTLLLTTAAILGWAILLVGDF